MPFSEEDRHAIKFLRQNKNYSARRFLKEFPNKGWTLGASQAGHLVPARLDTWCQPGWTLGGLNVLIRKIEGTGSIERRPGSGRKRSARTDENIEKVAELILSQEDQPQTHRSQRQTAREVGISQRAVGVIVKQDLKLKCLKRRRAHELTDANKLVRLLRCQRLLKLYPEHMVQWIWFTDEKLFTVATPNNAQNNRLYVSSVSRKKDISASRLLSTRPTFSQSVMVSVGVSALGRTGVYFVEPGTKINGQYYRDILLMQHLLPDMREHSEYFVFQQDSAPSHRARLTVELLQKETPAFISPSLWPPNSPDLNPVDYRIWSIMEERVYRTKIRDTEDLKHRIQHEWNQLDQRTIDEAVNEWRLRLRACVKAVGSHFEHKL
jgi:inhibitor of nuclear factor kappa-B kinase subunit alpha